MDDVLRGANDLAVTLSLSDTTGGLLGDQRLQLMKASAFLLDVAQAEIVDETALQEALAYDPDPRSPPPRQSSDG